MPNLKIACSAEGFENSWVEITDHWTRKEFNDVVESEGDQWLEIFRKKVVACNLEIFEEGPDGEWVVAKVIDDPKNFSEEDVDELPMQIIGFLSTVLLEGAAHLRKLGFMSGRIC